MDARLPESTKWTPFPEELLEQIQGVFSQFFEDYELENGRFTVEGAIYPTEIMMRVGLVKPGQLRQDNFEASLEYKVGSENVLPEIHTVIDFLGQTWQDYLEEPPETNEELPRDWLETPFEKKKVFLKYSTVNTDLEKEADRLLQSYEKKLVYEKEGDELEAAEAVANFKNPFRDGDEAEEESLH